MDFETKNKSKESWINWFAWRKKNGKERQKNMPDSVIKPKAASMFPFLGEKNVETNISQCLL